MIGVTCLIVGAVQAKPTLTIDGETPGATPFISFLHLSADQAAKLDAVTFKVKSKPGSVVRPVTARYSAAYLRRRGYLNPDTGEITVPVFGLYANYGNTVKLRSVFTNGAVQKDTLTIPTATYQDDAHANPEVLLPRTADSSLSYSFYLLKSLSAAGDSPLIFDTDGELRWAGVAGAQTLSSMMLRKGIYANLGTAVARMELDGMTTMIGDYAAQGVVDFHHNFDAGREGILIEVDTADWVESTVLEIDPIKGDVLHRWDLAEIISDAMTAGGDDPSRFVKFAPADWFHNNSTTYRASDNTLIVSSREDFVIAVDYDTHEIRWILGNETKTWAQFPSLRRFALALGADTHPPIGQHALSIVDDHLLLFENGYGSGDQADSGKSRTFSAARKYRIDTDDRVATEEWHYTADKKIYSPICSSVAEDAPGNFLLNYSSAGPFLFVEIMGLNAAGEKVFDYKYPAAPVCSGGFNAQIVHLERLKFNR